MTYLTATVQNPPVSRFIVRVLVPDKPGTIVWCQVLHVRAERLPIAVASEPWACMTWSSLGSARSPALLLSCSAALLPREGLLARLARPCRQSQSSRVLWASEEGCRARHRHRHRFGALSSLRLGCQSISVLCALCSVGGGQAVPAGLRARGQGGARCGSPALSSSPPRLSTWIPRDICNSVVM